MKSKMLLVSVLSYLFVTNATALTRVVVMEDFTGTW
jgi:hypothetical protein